VKDNILFAPCQYCAGQNLTEKNSREAKSGPFSTPPEFKIITNFCPFIPGKPGILFNLQQLKIINHYF
jgi:hypothetical protein